MWCLVVLIAGAIFFAASSPLLCTAPLHASRCEQALDLNSVDEYVCPAVGQRKGGIETGALPSWGGGACCSLLPIVH